MGKLARLALALFASTLLFSTPAPAETPAGKSEGEIRQLLERWEKAFRAKNIDAVMAVYAPEAAVVAYDVVPPLQIAGKKAYRKSYEDFFAMYQGPLDFECRDLKIVAGRDVAFIYCLERVSGTLQNGQKSDLWIRATSGLRKISGRWLIVHDHISVPVDFETGKAALDLKP
jgi:uncharacterized protein (TIGR02246 family)